MRFEYPGDYAIVKEQRGKILARAGRKSDRLLSCFRASILMMARGARLTVHPHINSLPPYPLSKALPLYQGERVKMK
jgi:hypothetical protein